MNLEIGTIEELETEPEKKTKPKSSFGGGSNNGNGRNRGGGGGGDDSQDNKKQPQTDDFNADKYRVGMGLILLVVLMTFGGLIGVYVVLATNQALEWKPFQLPIQVWVSTFLILISSLFYEFGNRALQINNQIKAKKWFLITSILGAIFIASQILSWVNLVNSGYYVSGNSYAGIFYILTAIHAVHVLGGIISLGYIVLKTQNITTNETELLRRQWFSKVVGWYWHFVGVLWIVLFLLLGFYK
jgi:cytochrome c oxidase subunit III